MTRAMQGGRRVARGRRHVSRIARRLRSGQVLEVRIRLEANPWAQVGAPAIAWELQKLGAVVPPERTIERILRRAGTTGRPRSGRRASKGIAYPAPAANRAGDVVQVDLVGPRHLDGGVRFHALNQIDVCSRHAGIEIVVDRGDERVVSGPAQRSEPLAIDEIPAGWPATGRIEFIRFIRSDHKLRLLGRAITIPDGHAYLTATLDLSIAPAHDNLLVCDEHGELITNTRLNSPRR